MPSTQTPTTGDQRLDLALAATGFRWRLEPNFKVQDVTSHLQHRRDDGLNGPAVKRYVNMLKAGSMGPPCCVTRDGMLVFGNHRFESFVQGGVEMFEVIVLDVDGVGADENVTNSLLSVAYAENSPHGVPYSPRDRMEAARHLVSFGSSNRSIQQELGLSAAQVSGVKREVEAQAKLDRLGLSTTGLSHSALRALAGPDARALTDEPFKALVALAKDSAFTSAEVNQFAKEARSGGTEAAAVNSLLTVRNSLTQRIADTSMYGQQRPTPVGKLKTALKAVLTLCSGSTPDLYRDMTATVVETSTMLDDAIRCLSGIRKIQELPED